MATRRRSIPMEVDSNSTKDDNLLKRCKQFAEVTHTDNALAMMYLQDRDWNLENAVSDFFRDNGKPQSVTVDCIDLTESDDPSDLDTSVVFKQSNILNVLSWNIDGLDRTNFHVRLQALVNCIKSEKPDIVCLQEVIIGSLNFLRHQLESDYNLFSATDDQFSDCIHYFVVLLIRKQAPLTVDLSSFTVTPFPESKMGRHTVAIDVLLDSSSLFSRDAQHRENASLRPAARLRIITSHLESCREGAAERKKQLKQIWQRMQKFSTSSILNPDQSCRACIFCGDLNLRDSEVAELGGVPAGIWDVWEQTGSRPELRSTWDPSRNTNAARFFAHQPAIKRPQPHRYDRMYYCPGGYLKAIDFGLRGLERITQHTCFPSDHWGILGRYVITL